MTNPNDCSIPVVFTDPETGVFSSGGFTKLEEMSLRLMAAYLGSAEGSAKSSSTLATLAVQDAKALITELNKESAK